MELPFLFILEDKNKFSEKNAPVGETRKENKTFIEKYLEAVEHENTVILYYRKNRGNLL